MAVHDVLQCPGRCVSDDCSRERLYLGSMVSGSRVLLQAGHKWDNEVYWNHTALPYYPTYALGGGYVLSRDVVELLVSMKVRRKTRAKVLPGALARQLIRMNPPSFAAAAVVSQARRRTGWDATSPHHDAPPDQSACNPNACLGS